MPRIPTPRRPSIPTGPVTEADLPPDLKLVTCSRCQRRMRGWTNREPGFAAVFPRLFARVYGRPVCAGCYEYAVREPRPVETSFAVKGWEG